MDREDFNTHIRTINEELEKREGEINKELHENDFQKELANNSRANLAISEQVDLTNESEFFPSFTEKDYENTESAINIRDDALKKQIDDETRKRLIPYKELYVQQHFEDHPERLEEAEGILGLDQDREWLENREEELARDEEERANPLSDEFQQQASLSTSPAIDLQESFDAQKGGIYNDRSLKNSFPGYEEIPHYNEDEFEIESNTIKDVPDEYDSKTNDNEVQFPGYTEIPTPYEDPDINQEPAIENPDKLEPVPINLSNEFASQADIERDSQIDPTTSQSGIHTSELTAEDFPGYDGEDYSYQPERSISHSPDIEGDKNSGPDMSMGDMD